ncbi:hypothetical protein EJB05_21175, partial [Eragrostis curvula]
MISLKDEPKDNQEMIGAIRKTLRSMGSGEISVSAYDTAWVALVKNLDSGGDGPQFPSSIKWIAQNQLPDGSWGDNNFFLVQDRIINTLACVIALKSWNVHEDQCKKGLSFIHENLWRLPEDDEDWMLAGFETIFPMLLDMAKDLGLDMACDEPILLTICAKRDLKLAKIPRDVLHSVPSALLLSLEGMPNLDWQKIFKLQSPDGSFMSSAAPTAYALMQTSDRKCLEFLDTIVTKFNGGVPFVYPVEMYERLWAVDRLERLGISYYFRSEIESCLDYAYRWCEKNNLDIYGVTPESALRVYFLAAANIFEPDRAAERLAWAHTAVLAEAISSYLWSNNGYTDGMREQLVSELIGCGDNEARGANDLAENGLVHALNELIDLVASDDFSNTLREAWQEWLMARIPKESHESCGGDTSLLLIRTIEICSGRHGSYKQNLNLSEYSHLEKLIFSICCKLSRRDQ